MRGLSFLIAAVAGVFAPAAAWAQTAPRPAVPDWIVTVGVGGRLMPAFEGSDRFTVMPYPIVEIRRGGTPRQFSSPRDGFSFAIVNFENFYFGPTGKVVLPRYESDDRAALRGLGTVDWAVELGVFVEYWPLQWLRTRAEVRQGIGGHDGIVSDISADVVVPMTPTTTFSAGPRVTLATAEALRPYFGITAVQSANSGLPVYSPGGGVKAVGAGAQVRYQWSPQWATNVFVEYDRLLGDTARSPIVRRNGSADQVQVGIGLSYAFDVTF